MLAKLSLDAFREFAEWPMWDQTRMPEFGWKLTLAV